MTVTLKREAIPTIHRIGGRLGARVDGILLNDPISPQTSSFLKSALLTHKVLFFRDQDITDADQLAFAEVFGPLTDEHPLMRTVDGSPQVIPVHGDDQRANHWHIDVSFTPKPSLATILRAVELPPLGGDTLVANGESAYRDLPAELRVLADSLWAVHSNRADQPRLGTARAEAVRKAFRSKKFEAAHPVVRLHPDSGEPAIFLGSFVRRFVGMTEAQSQSLISVFNSYVQRPENCVRWSWKLGDVIIFDNRNTQHYGVDDYEHHTRILQRVSVTGDVPKGIDGRSSYWVEGDDE